MTWYELSSAVAVSFRSFSRRSQLPFFRSFYYYVVSSACLLLAPFCHGTLTCTLTQELSEFAGEDLYNTLSSTVQAQASRGDDVGVFNVKASKAVEVLQVHKPKVYAFPPFPCDRPPKIHLHSSYIRALRACLSVCLAFLSQTPLSHTTSPPFPDGGGSLTHTPPSLPQHLSLPRPLSLARSLATSGPTGDAEHHKRIQIFGLARGLPRMVVEQGVQRHNTSCTRLILQHENLSY